MLISLNQNEVAIAIASIKHAIDTLNEALQRQASAENYTTCTHLRQQIEAYTNLEKKLQQKLLECYKEHTAKAVVSG